MGVEGKLLKNTVSDETAAWPCVSNRNKDFIVSVKADVSMKIKHLW